jgi:hypothetical protein
MNQQVNALDILARAKTLVLSRPQDFTQAGRDLDSDFSAESICAERRRVLSGFPVNLEHDLARQSTPWSRFGVALHDTAKLSPLGLDAAEARRVLVLAWLAFDSEADTRLPMLTEFQRLPWRGANDRFWQGREIPAENWVENAEFLRLVEAAFEKLGDAAPETGALAEFPACTPRAREVLRYLMTLAPADFATSDKIAFAIPTGVESSNLRSGPLPELRRLGLIEKGPGRSGSRVVLAKRPAVAAALGLPM